MDRIFSPLSDWGPLLLRLSLGITFLVHGWPKLNPHGPMKGPAGFAGWLKQLSIPLPLFFAWVVALLETVGAGLLILGIATRILAVGFTVDMLVAIWLVKRKMQKVRFTDQKGGWEFEFALMAQALALLFTGAGNIGLNLLAGW
jgi:putative oxidoreductase